MNGPDRRPDAADPLSQALAAAVHRTGARAGCVYLLDQAESVLCLVAMCGAPVETFRPWWRVRLASPGPTPDAVLQDRLIWVSCQEEFTRRYPRAAAVTPYRLAFAVVPLRGVRHRWGALLLMWPSSRPARLSRRERGRITAGARHITRVLDDAAPAPVIADRPRFVPPHHADTRQAPPALAAAHLVERLPLGALALDLEGRITFVNTAAAELLGRPAELLLGTQPWESLPWLDTVACMDAYRAAVTSREPFVLTVLRPPAQWLDLRLHTDESGTSVLVTPRRAADHPSDPADAQAALTGAPGLNRIHLLVYLAAALTETVGVQDVVDLAADQILPSFDAHGMIMSTVEANRIQIIGHQGYAPEVIEQLDGLPADADLTPAGRALATGEPSYFADRAELARACPEAPQISGKQAWAFLPLITSGRPIGCFVLAHDHPHRFTASERSVLTPLAALMAQALDRARLYDAKHSLAHALQRTLLPHALPAVTGLDVAARYLPASHGMDIGGDFYDLIRLTDTTAAAVIGDVQGHDVTAAALMGQVRTAVHSHATAGATPDQVLARTDRDLDDLSTDRFVSCLYAHIDLARHQVTLASAGHPPPLVRHPDNRAHTVDIDPGPPLGIGLGAPSYPLTALPLADGALLALYTDGLVEIPGTDIGRTMADLAQHLGTSGGLPLHHLVDSLVRRTRPTNGHTDDIALLLLRPTSGS
ncbi:SpoIIE family protein phosphatase [Streptomyces ipomoeae]|uniref:SpoIIE family protein phosphatase n=4 Tax=Streptomyces ipomoeae TaxID=103232 RepID=UPI0003020DAE|nr:SpoIIE family protein phosphatase [Streptomyces ipomoeae]MDX2826296.1 SpoIIE family protein phosphatase [Streptomyces ipomoeae]